MPFDDNRQFIAALDKTKDVVHIRQEVDWDMQVGGIIRRTHELHSPAPFFEKIKDYPPGYRIFGGPIATTRRFSIALGLPPETNVKTLQEEYESRSKNPIKPVMVDKAPCKEVKLLGDEVDLYHIPAPMIHEGDGGRYLCAWHATISKDPDSGWVNWGMYRAMIHNKHYLSGHWHIGNHIGMVFYQKFVPKNKPMPVSIAIGPDPICALVACSPIGWGQDEADYAGALRGKPVELVMSETNDFPVPAHAEIIIEGEILPGSMLMEGPFGEYTGYRTGSEYKPLLRVKAITHRKDPILTISNPGVPVDDTAVCYSITAAVAMRKRLQRHNLPVTDICIPPESGGYMVIISIKATASGIPAKVKEVLHDRRGWSPTVIVVEDDVDVFNMEQVTHALSTKCHPVLGIKSSYIDYRNPLTPYLTPEERKGTKDPSVLLDCTWPVEWSRETLVPPRVSFNEMYPKGLRDKIVKEWKDYGF